MQVKSVAMNMTQLDPKSIETFQFRAPGRIHLDGETDLTILDGKPLQHIQIDDVTAPVRVGYGFQSFQDLFLGDVRHK